MIKPPGVAAPGGFALLGVMVSLSTDIISYAAGKFKYARLGKFDAVERTYKKNHITAVLFVGLRQAYQAPASLGSPLSMPSACGRYEIYHLEVLPYSIQIIALRFIFVKYSFIFDQPMPFFFTNLHKCDDRVLVVRVISRCNKPESQSETRSGFYDLF